MEGFIPESEVRRYGFLHRKLSMAVAHATSEHGGVNCSSVAQNQIVNGMYPLELSDSI